MQKAQRAFVESRAKRLYLQAFGPSLGQFLWRVSRFEPFRVLARHLLELGFFKRFASLRAGMARTWS
jgi:hypothetical protein